jgi:hypothetical protein
METVKQQHNEDKNHVKKMFDIELLNGCLITIIKKTQTEMRMITRIYFINITIKKE